jgi:hypothetical protein
VQEGPVGIGGACIAPPLNPSLLRVSVGALLLIRSCLFMVPPKVAQSLWAGGPRGRPFICRGLSALWKHIRTHAPRIRARYEVEAALVRAALSKQPLSGLRGTCGTGATLSPRATPLALDGYGTLALCHEPCLRWRPGVLGSGCTGRLARPWGGVADGCHKPVHGNWGRSNGRCDHRRWRSGGKPQWR